MPALELYVSAITVLEIERGDRSDPRADRDCLIAATALVHAMTVVTRNVADFRGTGVALLDPWTYSAR